VFEGPFGDHTGFYSLPDRYPVVEVTAITHARDAIYPATIVGLPPQEDYWLGKATERVFLPLLKTIVHDVDDYHLPRFGCFHNAAFVRIRKSYAFQGRRLMSSVWGAGQMAWTKMIVVVDEGVPVHDEAKVLSTVFERCDFRRDVELVHGPLDILDHSAPALGAGTKMGLDATRKREGEQAFGIPLGDPRLPSREEADAALSALHAAFPAAAMPVWGHGRCTFIAVDKRDAGDGARAIERAWALLPAQPGAGDFLVVVDAGTDLHDWERVLFLMAANADLARDLHRAGHRLAIDATVKRSGDARGGYVVRRYPPLVGFDAATLDAAQAVERANGLRVDATP
jgi:4-hydroxy-3-polyprenylbenzoate decarboxylase